MQPTPLPRGDGYDVLEQPSATIETQVCPGNVLQEIRLNADRADHRKMVPYESPQMLGIATGDIVLYPRTYEEVNSLFGIPLIHARDRCSKTMSAFSAFNGRFVVDRLDDLHTYYKFLGLARSAVSMQATDSAIKLSVVSSGVMNYVNHTALTIEPHTPMTWTVLDSRILDPLARPDKRYPAESLDVSMGGAGGWAPPEKRRNTRSMIIKAVFVPVQSYDIVRNFPDGDVMEIVTSDSVKRMREQEAASSSSALSTSSAPSAPSAAKPPSAEDEALRHQTEIEEALKRRVTTAATASTKNPNSFAYTELIRQFAGIAYGLGVRDVSRHNTHIIGNNAGKPVRPGMTGQIELF